MKRASCAAWLLLGSVSCATVPEDPVGDELRKTQQQLQRLEEGQREIRALLQVNRDRADDIQAMHAEVPFTLGRRELAEGDQIRVDRIVGNRDRLASGGRYLVMGSYTLASQEEATLTLSVTDTQGSSHDGRASTGGSLQVQRGSGTFSLPLTLWAPGKPHLSLVDPGNGRAVSVLYFGDGPWLWAAEPG